MKAIIYEKKSNQIIEIITNVISYTATDIFGDIAIYTLNTDNIGIMIFQDTQEIDTSKTADTYAEFDIKAQQDNINSIDEQNIVIKNQLDILDQKRIRAFIEGGINNDGISYLDVYNQQIKDLRAKLK